MSNYLKESSINLTKNINSPIVPVNIDWNMEDKKISKIYEFEESKFLEAFIIQILKYNRESDVVVEFRVKKDKVGVIIHANSYMITSLELEAKDDIEKIKKDVMYYYAK